MPSLPGSAILYPEKKQHWNIMHLIYRVFDTFFSLINMRLMFVHCDPWVLLPAQQSAFDYDAI